MKKNIAFVASLLAGVVLISAGNANAQWRSVIGRPIETPVKPADPIAPAAVECAAAETSSAYTAQLGEKSWMGALDHKPQDYEAVFAVPTVALPGDVTTVSGLEGTFFIGGTNLDCGQINAHVFVKVTVPGYSDYAEDSWYPLNIALSASDPAKCAYAYSLPSPELKKMTTVASAKHKDAYWGEHYVAVVMKASNGACLSWENRYYVDLYEGGKGRENDPLRAWNSDFGQP